MGASCSRSNKKNSFEMRAIARVSRSFIKIPETPSQVAILPPPDLQVMRGVVQSTCITCELKHRPEVFAFLKLDLPLYHNVTLEDGAHFPTCLLLLNPNDKVLRNISLWDKGRVECNEILLQYGFYRKERINSQVPQEYQYGPYSVLT